MKPTPRQQITIASASLGAGLLLLGITPRVPSLDQADRALIGWLLARTGADAASLHGTGDHDDPRRVRGAPVRVPAGDLPPPRFLAITDDPEGLFESRPPGPIDLAYLLERLHHLGHTRFSTAALLAWENPDPIAAGALDHELGRFQLAVVGAPLVRGLSDEPLPAAFSRLSVPLERITGDASALPIVNRIAVPGVRFGGDSTWAAFTRLESEAAPPFSGAGYSVPVPLLARWGTRVVVALPLAHLMARFGVSADQLAITPGADIRLGESGPIIPIDIHGQTPVRPETGANPVVIPAEDLVRPDPDQVPAALSPDAMPLLLRDDRTEAPAEVREYSAHLGDIIVALDRAPRAGQPQLILRPHTVAEVLLLGLLAWLTTRVARLPGMLRHPGFATLAAGALLSCLLLLSVSQCMPPPLAMVGAPLVGWAIVLFLPRENRPAAADPAARSGAPPPATAMKKKPAAATTGKTPGRKPRGKAAKPRRKRP